MSVKHYPYKGGSFDYIVFDGDETVWVRKDTCGSIQESTEGQEQTSAMQIGFNPFDMGTSDDKARKVCEEAMEFYAEHHECWSYGLTGNGRRSLFYEIGDVLTAILNYCAAEHIDPQRCIDRVEERNRNRGRYEAC